MSTLVNPNPEPSKILLPNGMPHELPADQKPPPREHVGIPIARHFGSQIILHVDREIEAYQKRHRLQDGEVHIRVIGSQKNGRVVRVELTAQTNGLPIVGVPKREFRIGLMMQV